MKLFSFVTLAVLMSSQTLFADAPAAGAPGQPGGVAPFVPLILIFAIFYFLIIRPQQKKAKLQAQFQQELKRGDMVVTNSGIVGTVKAVSDRLITLEIDDGVCLKVLRNSVLESATSLKAEPKPA